MIRNGYVGDLSLIMNIINEAVIDMDSRGIYQWDHIYPNVEVIKDDICKETLFVYEDNKIIKGIIVLNEFQDKEYESIDWRYNSGRQLRFSLFDITDTTEEGDPSDKWIKRELDNDHNYKTDNDNRDEDITQDNQDSSQKEVNFCPYCGVSITDNFAYCPKCGKTIKGIL